MSVFEPSTESDHRGTGDLPQFRVAVRGYDRQEVAAHIQELSAHLENERQRAEQAERTIAQMQLEMAAVKGQPPSFEHLGVEAAKVLEQAGHSAELLVDEAEGHGKAIVEEARTHAAELVAAAEQRAEQMRKEAHKDAKEALDEARETIDRLQREAQEERAEVTAETERLDSFRDSLLKHLGRVRQDLSALLDVPEDEADAPAEDAAEPAAGVKDSSAPKPAATPGR
ncbi:MAG TPA: DivIVA domain-containing protein [Actinomycetes bacterium]|jgi:cell division septum initiation protein DivIVA|nr:DivIVA domain-containing protein [Actinomycetes bacterium]